MLQNLAKSAAFFIMSVTILLSNGGGLANYNIAMTEELEDGNFLRNMLQSTIMIASASDYGSLTAEQKAVAEAWRVVDNSFIDRTFNGQDWFQMRQQAVKQKYKSMEEARNNIAFMIDKLGDKYTRYLPPDKYQSLVDSATGTLAGVGVEISTTADGKKVIAADVEENSPASRAGIQPNDVFLQVGGYVLTESSTPDDVASRLRGPAGSKVDVVVERPSNGKTIDAIVTREQYTVTSVKGYISDKVPGLGKVGVIRIKSFSGTTALKVTEMLQDLKRKGAQAFVLDVRRNPGGLLPGGVDTASLFLDANQPIVFTITKSGLVDAQETLKAGLDIDSPLVVLVDAKTASAAEVMTAALKENGRATVVGQESTTTFGKGIVQTIKAMSNNNGGIAVTVARYETPKHNDINKQGIAVDFTIPECTSQDAASCLPANVFKIN